MLPTPNAPDRRVLGLPGESRRRRTSWSTARMTEPFGRCWSGCCGRPIA